MKNPLVMIPPRFRFLVYWLISFAATAFGAWQAADGDWETAVAAILGALVSSMAGSNVDKSVVDEGVYYDGH